MNIKNTALVDVYQMTNLDYFLTCGLGKTVITLTAINDLKYNRFLVNKVLVIAPKKVAEDTWTREQEKWEHLSLLRIMPVLRKFAKENKSTKYSCRCVCNKSRQCSMACRLLQKRLAF